MFEIPIINTLIFQNTTADPGWLDFFRPFSGPLRFLTAVVISIVLIVFFTSFLYFAFHHIFLESQRRKKEAGIDDEDDGDTGDDELSPGNSLQITIIIFACVFGIAGYLLLKNALHSIRVDAFGNWMRVYIPPGRWIAPAVDTVLAVGFMGVVWGWARFFQTLLIRDIFKRYSSLVHTIPYYSAFLIVTFSMAAWYFYSNVFPLWWYVVSFGLIYGLIYYFSLKDFKRRIRMHMTRSIEFEEELSLKTISVGVGVIMVLGIAVPHAIFTTMSSSYIIILFVNLWLVSMYMTPGKVFRQVKLFPRYATESARILNFARYTRKYISIWFLFIAVIAFVLGAGIIFDPGFKNPHENLAKCKSELALIGQTMDQYMEENTNFLPSVYRWKNGKWLEKVKDKKFKQPPSCPVGGKYRYRKWRNENHVPIFEIWCMGGVHRRAGIADNFPRYTRFAGVVESRKELNKKLSDKKSDEPDNKE